jgi:pilus assembly protein CpaF
MTSIHANSALEALSKLTTLPLLAGENVNHSFIVPTVASSIDLIVHLSNDRGKRRTSEIVAVTGRIEGDRIESVPIWRVAGAGMRWSGHRPPPYGRFADALSALEETLR